jgi:hypothetical protein
MESIAWYKPNIDKTVERQRYSHAVALERRANEGCVTFRALPPSDIAPLDAIDLTSYRFETECDRYAKDWLKLLEASMNARREVDDNFIPNVSPMLGIGDYSAFVHGDIYFSRNTSWSKPVLTSIEGWKDFPPIGTAPWYRRFLQISEYLIHEAAKGGIPYMRGFFSPLDLAAALRGQDIYYDFYDDPEELHALLDYCANCTIHLATDLKAKCAESLGDTSYGMFYQDGINMSEDIACMISAELYREFCAPHTQKVIDAFGKGYMHCHSRAMYLVKEICALDHVATLWLATDPNQPRPIEHIEMLVRDARSVCLNIDCNDFSEIENHAGALFKGNFSVCLPVKDIAEAISLTERAKGLFGG